MNKELTPEQKLAQQHLDVYNTIKDHFLSLRRLLTVAIESIDASVKVLEMNPKIRLTRIIKRTHVAAKDRKEP